MAKGDEVLRNVYDESTNTLGINGSVSLGGTATQITTSQDLSAGALNYTTSVGDNFVVKGIYFSFTLATTQTISLEYNGIPIFSDEGTSMTSAKICGDISIYAGLGQELTVKCTNTGTPASIVSVTLDIEVI